VALAERNEGGLRHELRTAIEEEVSGLVLQERNLPLPDFPGVGGVDLIVVNTQDRGFRYLAELKWSTDPRRDKIFEAAWDLVKLAIAGREPGIEACCLVTGASRHAWEKTECADIFEGATIEVEELWRRPLYAPGPNGGKTVGEDLEIGGRGNIFLRAPNPISTVPIAQAPIASEAGNWELRAVAVFGGKATLQFADPSPFPRPITQKWLNKNVPRMEDELYERLLAWLRKKGWTAHDLETRVYPLRRDHGQK
jgi:hypothetical protein